MPNDRNSGFTYTDKIGPDASGQTVLDFYTQRYLHSTRAEWQARIENGTVQLEGARTTSNTQLHSGQRLTYHRQPWKEPDVPLTFSLLHEDAHVLVVAKPSGLPVLPGGHHLKHTLLALIRDRFGDHPSPMHRLGRGTSGMVLFARTHAAKQTLSRDFHDGRIVKHYRALSVGTEMSDTFVIDTPIGRIPYPKIGFLYAATPGGKPSRSECHVLHRDSSNNRSLIHVNLITGRPHQIRIHLAAAGHPLWGDPLYAPGGGPISTPEPDPIPLPGDCGYHLHAHHLKFTHPITQNPCVFTCAPPPLLRTPEEQP
ncbi:MAG: RluA family pseudouridine synthase [bacterium]|nr:RluA family pseudouridine synthase [bacterium]